MATRTPELEVKNYIVTLHPELGRGAFGAVFRAKHKVTNEILAVKKILVYDQSQGRNEEIAKMAYKEIRSNQHLGRHANIIKFLDHAIDNAAFWIFMEYCDLGDLNHYLLVKNPSLHQKLNIMFQSANGLEYLHSLHPPIVHRDIKPQNILLKRESDRDIVKLTDFGMCRLLDNNTNQPMEVYMTTMGGTAFYMAPEFFAERELKYIASVDIFALGLVFLVTLQYKKGDKEQDMKPRTVNTKASGKECYVGLEMKIAADSKSQMPKIVDLCDQDDDAAHGIKQVIHDMVVYDYHSRKPIAEVKEDLEELLGDEMPELADLHLDDVSVTSENPETIHSDAPLEKDDINWIKCNLRDIEPADHISWWTDQDKSIIMASYWRHAIVSAKAGNNMNIVGWKFRSEGYKPVIVEEVVNLEGYTNIYKAQYKTDQVYNMDVTLRRARGQIGDKDYNIISNYARAFPRWCKTGYGGPTYRAPPTRGPTWKDVPVIDIAVGDHVRWWSGIYCKHSIVLSPYNDGQITSIGWTLFPHKKIEQQSKKFKPSDIVCKAFYNRGACYSDEEIVRRAESRNGEASYDVIRNFARGFPRWCVTGYGGMTYDNRGSENALSAT